MTGRGLGRGVAAPTRPGPTAAAAPQLNTQKLQALVAQLEELKGDFRSFRDGAAAREKRSVDREKILYAENTLLKAEMRAIVARVRYLEDLQGVETEEPEASGEGEAEGEGTGEGGGPGESGTASARTQRDVGTTPEEIAASTYHAASNEIKEVVSMGFALLMDTKIDGKNLPGYPEPDEEWPVHTITGEAALRFDWTKTDKDKVNIEGVDKVMKWVLASGATEVKHAAPGLTQILTGDLRKRCFIKFNYMRTQWRAFNKNKSKEPGAGRTGDGAQGAGAGGVGEDGAPGEEDGEEGEHMEAREPEQDEGTKRGVLRVRAEKTAEQRKRKAEGTEWHDAKYAAAFLPNAMSDYEDHVVEPGQPKTYLARAPWYRSQLQQDIFDALDARPDTNPDKARAMVSRVRGPVKQDIEPPKARRVDTALRIWQVDEQALADNPHWLASGRVVANGKLWGDAEDPVDEGPASAKGKGRGGPPKIRRPEGAGDVSEARARFKAATAGVDIDGLFAS